MRRKRATGRPPCETLLLTLLLGTAFLGIKGYEYYHKFEEHLVPGRNFAIPSGPTSTPIASTVIQVSRAKSTLEIDPQARQRRAVLFASISR